MQLFTLALSLLAHYAYLVIPTVRGLVTSLFRASPFLLSVQAPLEEMLVREAGLISPEFAAAVDKIIDADLIAKKEL